MTINHTFGDYMKYMILLLFLVGCKNVVKHEGEVKTENTVKIQIDIPENVINTFVTICEDRCSNDENVKECVNLCKAEEQSKYINQLLEFINQFQQENNKQ